MSAFNDNLSVNQADIRKITMNQLEFAHFLKSYHAYLKEYPTAGPLFENINKFVNNNFRIFPKKVDFLISLTALKEWVYLNDKSPYSLQQKNENNESFIQLANYLELALENKHKNIDLSLSIEENLKKNKK